MSNTKYNSVTVAATTDAKELRGDPEITYDPPADKFGRPIKQRWVRCERK